jgi:acetylornithine deacetylase
MVEQIVNRIFQALDDNKSEVLKLTQDLVAFKSINPIFMSSPEASEEAKVQDFVEGLMKAMKLDITRTEHQLNRPNLVGARRGKGGGKSLIFNGHIDVVPTGDESVWEYDPWGKDIADGRLYGRGTMDMKGGVAAFLTAAKAVIDAGIELKGDLSLHVVVDEEGGGFAGTRRVVGDGHLGDAVIVAEPTDEKILAAEGGLTWLRVTIRGRSAHAGWRYAQIYPQGRDGAPESHGVNALEKGVRFIQAVRELEREWALRKHHPLLPAGITTLNPGTMAAGVGVGADGLPVITNNAAMIPDTCVMLFDFKFLPTESFEQVKAEFEAFVSGFAQTDPWLKENPPKLEWHFANIYFPPFSTAVDHPLVQVIQTTQGDLNMESVISGFPAVTDGGFYAGAGVTPLILGPLGSGLHGVDEYINIESLTRMAKVYAGTILRWCEVAD